MMFFLGGILVVEGANNAAVGHDGVRFRQAGPRAVPRDDDDAPYPASLGFKQRGEFRPSHPRQYYAVRRDKDLRVTLNTRSHDNLLLVTARQRTDLDVNAGVRVRNPTYSWATLRGSLRRRPTPW